MNLKIITVNEARPRKERILFLLNSTECKLIPSQKTNGVKQLGAGGRMGHKAAGESVGREHVQ